MNVLLVRPILLNALTLTRSMDCEPLELEYMAAACRLLGVEAVIYDGIVESRPFSRVLRDIRPDVVAITGYLTQENAMRRYAALAKQAGCTVVLGGVHVQLNYRRLYDSAADFLQRGESMEDFSALLLALRDGGRTDKINGLCRRAADGTFTENPLIPCDITALPLPDRSFRDNHADAFRYLDFSRVSTMKTAVSCPFDCMFCYGTRLHGGRYQARPVDAVLDELETIRADTVFIVDHDFLVDENRLRALLAGLRERNIHKRYICYARADFIAAHPALTGELCAAGFSYFLVGIEGIEDSHLKSYAKGTTRSINETCIDILHGYGATCVALLIADLSFRPADFRRLYGWIRDSGLRYASVSIFTPIPGTPLYARYEEAGRLREKRIEKYDLLHPVVRPDHLPAWRFLLHYRMLLARLGLLGLRRGAYRFVTPRYLAGVVSGFFRRLGTRR